MESHLLIAVIALLVIVVVVTPWGLDVGLATHARTVVVNLMILSCCLTLLWVVYYTVRAITSYLIGEF